MNFKTLKKLTPRQLAILKLVATGMENKQIAIELGIGTATVKNQLYLMYDKLGVKNRTEAALVAWQGGLIVQ